VNIRPLVEHMPAYVLSITERLRTLSLKALGSVSQVIPGSIPIPLSLAIPVRYLCMYQWVHQHIYDLHPSFHLQEQKEPFPPTKENQEDLLVPLDTPFPPTLPDFSLCARDREKEHRESDLPFASVRT